MHEIHPDEIGFGYGFSNDNPAEQIFLAASNGEIQTVVKDFGNLFYFKIPLFILIYINN